MPSRKKKTAFCQDTYKRLPFTTSKRKKDESFSVSPSKRNKNYVIISDSDSSSSSSSSSAESDEDEDNYQIESNDSSSTTRQNDNNNSDSDTGSAIIVDLRSASEKNKVVAQNRNLDEVMKRIPIEVHQSIVKYLPSDADITRYTLVCKTTSRAVSDSVWRFRFLEKFDAIPDASPASLRIKYQFRRCTTRLYTKFDWNEYKYLGRGAGKQQERHQRACLEMLQSLLVESDARKVLDDNGNEVIVSRNFDYIRDYVSFVSGTTHTGNMIDIVDSICKTNNNWNFNTVCSVDCPSDSNTLVLLIQLCLTWISWDRRYCTNTISHFDLSQLEAYASPVRQPIFLGKWKTDLNVRWCLHVANFFKFHLKAGKGEGLLAHAYADLPQTQCPQPWLGQLQPGTQQLGSHWKGAYFYVNADELARMRMAGDDTDSGPYSDELDGGEFFQDISLFFDTQKFDKQHWPECWERVLQSDPFSNTAPEPVNRHGPRRNTRSRKNIKEPMEVPNPGLKYFYGSSNDSSSTAHFYGAVHAIPPQGEIFGFQRVCIMKFFPDENGNFDPGQCWGYEGCVLPGGRIILGRWFDARFDSAVNVMSGPFVFWNVDDSEAEDPIDGKEALKFYELMKSYGHY